MEQSVWSLIQNNEFEKACEKSDEEYRTTGDMLSLRNKVYALFHLRKYNDANSLSEKLIEYRKGDTSSDFSFSGIAYWILGNTTKAIQAWHQVQNSLYKDAAGGMDIQVLLYFAAIKTGQNKLKATAVKTIKKLLKSKRATNFPGPLGHYLIDDITDKELLSYVFPVPILRERQLCQAHFVIAIKKLESGDIDGYYRSLRNCISYGPASYLSQVYYLAQGELEVVE